MKPRINHQGNAQNHQYLMWTNSTFLRLLCYSYLYGRIDPSIIVKLLDLEHNLHLTVWFTWPLGGVEVRFCFGSCQDFGCSSLKLTYCQWSDISAQLVHWNFIYLESDCRLKIWKKLWFMEAKDQINVFKKEAHRGIDGAEWAKNFNYIIFFLIFFFQFLAYNLPSEMLDMFWNQICHIFQIGTYLKAYFYHDLKYF